MSDKDELAPHRVALLNLGCRVNRVEIDAFAAELERVGCVIAPAEDAEVVVLNTCAVTGEAQAKTRKAVRRAARLPQAPVVIATGCVATLFAAELMEAAPGVVVEPRKSAVVRRVLEALDDGSSRAGDGGARPCHQIEAAGLAGAHATVTPTGRTRPGIKIQDGCDNRCSYCIVWKARGPSRSLPVPRVLEAVGDACAQGACEVVLTGINLGRYESDGTDIARLLDLLLEHTAIERIRLSSIEPPDVSDSLLAVMAASSDRVAPFLHVCLQSGCDATLRRMRRAYDTAAFRDVVGRARAHVPGIALGTDLIVGFPGETDEEYEQTHAFCHEMRFAKMHVFRFSPRPGTPAATAPHQVPAHVSASRSARMRTLARHMRDEQMRSHVGELQRVLVQERGTATSPHLYDVRVDASLPIGRMATVRIELDTDGTLIGVAP